MTSPEQWVEAAVGVANEKNLPLVILGGVSGGAEAVTALLHQAGERFLHVDELHCQPRAVYVITTNDDRYAEYSFSPGSVVIDPFNFIPSRAGISVFCPAMIENSHIDPNLMNVTNFDHIAPNLGEI